MADKVLIYSRFPKSMMARFAERFELLDTGGKPAGEVFSADELGGIRAMLTAGGSPLGAEAMDLFPKLGTIVCYGTGYDGVYLKAAEVRGPGGGRAPACRPRRYPPAPRGGRLCRQHLARLGDRRESLGGGALRQDHRRRRPRRLRQGTACAGRADGPAQRRVRSPYRR